MDQKNVAIEQLNEHVRQLESGPLSAINSAVSEVVIENAAEEGKQADGTNSILNHVPQMYAGSPTPSGKHMAANSNINNAANNENMHFNALANSNARGGLTSSHLNPQDFMTQLAVTRQLIYQVLEQHDALPDSKTSSLLRRNNQKNVNNANNINNNNSNSNNANSNGTNNYASHNAKSSKSSHTSHSHKVDPNENKTYYQAMTHANVNSIANHSLYDIHAALPRTTDVSPVPPRPPANEPIYPEHQHSSQSQHYQEVDSSLAVSNDSMYRFQNNVKTRKNALVPSLPTSSYPLMEEKHEASMTDSPPMPPSTSNKTPVSTSSSSLFKATTSARRANPYQTHQSPASSNLTSALVSPTSHHRDSRKNAILTPPNSNLGDFSAAITNSVDRNGTPITTVDLGMRSNLRKMTRNMELGAANPTNLNLLASPPSANNAGKSPLVSTSYNVGQKFRK